MSADYTRVHRLLKIMTLIHSRKGWAAPALAKELGVSVRTIYRDMETLEESGIPFTYDEKSKCYEISREFFMQPVELTLEESLALIALGEHIGGDEQIPFTKAAAKAVAKIRSQLPETIRREVDEVDAHLAIRLSQTTAADGAEDVYEKVRQALASHRVLLCEYEAVSSDAKRPAKSAAGGAFKLKPYALLFSQRAWYVIGHRSDRNEVRTMKLSRFTRVDATDEKYEIPASFSVKKHLGNAWRMIRGAKSYDVELQFDKAFADTVADTNWHATQKIDWNDDGSITMRIKVDGLDEIVWWVLGMGPNCVVKRPKELATRVKELAGAIVAKYS